MTDKKIIVKNNEQIIIEVRRKKRSMPEADFSQMPKGIINLRRPDDDGRRRLKKSGFINFYDLDSTVNEDMSLTDDYKLVVPSLADIHSGDFTGYYTAILNKYKKALDTPLDQWKTKFEKIAHDNSRVYRIRIADGRDDYEYINEFNSNWIADKGLKEPKTGELTPPTLPGVYEVSSERQDSGLMVWYERANPTEVMFWDGLFENLFFSSAFCKVTAIPNQAASAIPDQDDFFINLTSQKEVNIFLNRRMVFFKSTRTNSGLTPNFEALDYFWTSLPKAVSFGNSDYNTERADSDFSLLIGDMYKSFQHHPNARELYYNASSDTYSNSGSPGDWNDSSYDYSLSAEQVFLSGRFMGAIQAGSNWYFFWAV